MPFSKVFRASSLLVMLAVAAPATATQRQQAPEPVVPSKERAVTTVSTLDADELRRQFEDVLKAYPPSLPRVLRLDPTLISNDNYLQPYPALVTFLNQHPEIRHNPAYFLAGFREDGGYYRETAQE